MKGKLYRFAKLHQYVISILSVAAVSGICFALYDFIPYRIVALILLVTVSLAAMLFDMLPVMVAALLSALIWNFFFIPPRFTFTIGNSEDVFMFLMYFVVAMVNAALTIKIRRMEKEAVKEEEKERTLILYNTLLNSLSHELRTPISTVIAATDNLQSNSEKLTGRNRQELIAEISSASFRLNQQVENLLSMSRLEAGAVKLKKDWCDINELVYDLVRRIEQNKITQEIHININPAIPLFKLDKGIIEQVLYNLLLNAATYTPDTSEINITASYHIDNLEIIIEDNGNGFPENEIKKVFDKFYRLKHSKPGGTGLGLSIAKGFVEAHGGTIKLHNIPAGGAKFTIEIPAEVSYIKNLKNE